MQMAKYFAQLLNCSSHQACGHCSKCQDIEEEKDGITIIRPDNNLIKIEVVRKVQAQIKTSPVNAENHVIVIDEADVMNRSATNALLKSLEEPQPGVYFILLSHSIQSLIPTVLSRCMKYMFLPLKDGDLRTKLQEVSPEAAPEQLEFAVAYGNGSIDQALQVLNSDSIKERGHLLDIIDGIFNRKPNKELFSQIEQLGKKIKLLESIDFLVFLFRDVLVMKVSGESKLCIAQDQIPLIQKIDSQITEQGIMKILEYIEFFMQNKVMNPNPQMFWDGLVFSIWGDEWN